MSELKKWLERINESDIKKFYDKKSLKKIPKYIDTKAIKIIDNYNSLLKKQEIKQSIFEFKFFKFAFATLASVIIIFFTVFLFINILPEYGIKKQIKTNILSYTGDYKIEGSTESNKKILSIKTNDIIKTGKNSTVAIGIGDKTTLNIFELSDIKFIELSRNNLNEISRILLNKGKMECFVNLSTKESIFEINTDVAKFTVKGTHFILSVDEKKRINLNVIRGIVEVSDFIKKTEVVENLKIESDIYNSLQQLIDQNIKVKENDSISINADMINKVNNDFNLLIDRIKNNLNENKDIINDIQKIKNTISNFLTSQNENEKIQMEENIKITTTDTTSDKSEIKFTGNKFIFVYQWAQNQTLDQRIELLKKQIISKTNNPLVYSISYENIDIYYSKVNNIIFFFTSENLENNLNLKKYTGISQNEIKKQFLSNKNKIIKNIYNNKYIVIFYGDDENDLIKSIKEYK